MNPIYNLLGSEGYGAYEVDWTASPPTFTRVIRSTNSLLIPGFIDLHIHGAYGIDTMSATTQEFNHLCDRLMRDGYEGFLPTTISSSAADVQAMLDRLPANPLILGFHLEGPFISPKFPGAQPPSAIVDAPSGPSEWDPILDDPRLKQITLAPEIPSALQLATRLMQRGVIVSMGHTNATYDEARFGFEFGVSQATHMFNAMRPFHHREAGAVGYALANDNIRCELIYDLHHVSKESAALLMKMKPQDRVIAVSDSSAASGMPHNQKFKMWGHEVETGRGNVTIAGTNTLAGSAQTLLDCFRNLADDFGVEAAIRLCCVNPRAALGITGVPRVFCELDSRREVVGMRVLR